ncbi:shikimate kinase [Mycoplasmatota bacterium WC44]
MYYLIGKSLKHSLSEYIHQRLSSITYKCKELDELDEFFRLKEFKGINVTIPYKQDVIRYLDYLEPNAAEIGAVNTIVNREGKLYGYNTDYDGFKALLKRNNIEVLDKRVLVLGTGGSSKTVHKVMSDLNAKSTSFCSRTKSLGVYTYSEIEDYDFEIVVNTTPNGMYPNNDAELLFSLDKFKSLEAIVDLVYNPLTTKFLSSVDDVKKANGLYMLVYQAYVAHKHFIDKDIDVSIVEDIFNELLNNNVNIVLIGMPMSGKSSYGKQLSKILNKELVDIDIEIVDKEKKTIRELFEVSEDHFRKIETRLTCDYAKKHNQVISTGGGVIKNSKNIEMLKQNGIIIFIDRPLKDILDTDSEDRPLIKDEQSLIELYNSRIELYKQYCDIIIRNNINLEVLYEVINTKWS